MLNLAQQLPIDQPADMNAKPQSLFQIVSKGASVTRDVLLAAMGLLCLALGIMMALVDKLPAAGTLFTAGLLLCIFSSLSRFESIKGLGIEAKMTALDNKLNEADQLLGHIRDSVGLMADISFQAMARIGFYDATIPKQEALVIADAFRKQLRELGDSEAEINRRMDPWHESNLRRLTLPIYNGLRDFVFLQNQRLTEQPRSVPLPLNGPDPHMTWLNDQLTKNGAFIRQIDERWRGHLTDFGMRAEELVKSAPCGTAEERQALAETLTTSIEDARYYVANKDFHDRQRWIDAPG
jgi:hypothetical protein